MAWSLALTVWTSGSARAAAPAVTMTVDVAHPGAAIRPTMWGIFFEDINFGADGGLYGELVKNRSFEFPDPLMGWTVPAGLAQSRAVTILEDNAPSATNQHYLHLQASPDQPASIGNRGFRQLSVRAGERYRFSVLARTPHPAAVELHVLLVRPDGTILAQEHLKRFTPAWARRTATLRPKTTEADAELRVIAQGAGAVDLDMVSLFPEKTWRGRPEGLRADLVQMLADLKPGFVRFPGGCIVEGRDLSKRYDWKATIGPSADRRGKINRWNDEFKHRPAPDYFQSFGLGFFEFFQMCEDIGAEPLPILNCGMACQFNTGELVPLDGLDPYIQDALDLIEFAKGAPTTPWGRRRAEMGHPRPFTMNLLGIGNEQWGPQYIERYARFATALKAAHPEIQLISSAGPGPADDKFAFAWPKLRELKADIVDEHCYARPDWFLNNTTRYDHYDRSGPKVFMGEYAAQSVKTVSPDNRNTWECALAEAAYMIGLERNADVVVMSSYAPLLAHVDAWQWTPNLIWFDNVGVYGTPNYYVQQLFSRNRGDVLLPTRLSGVPTMPTGEPRFYASASRDAKSGEVLVKVVNATSQIVTSVIHLDGVTRVRKGTGLVLASADLQAQNSLQIPRHVAPQSVLVPPADPSFEYSFKPVSVTVLRLRTR